jgi:alpha-2-macroglobulin
MLAFRLLSLALSLPILTLPLAAADTLRVLSAGPTGEVSSLAQANEVRVVFSEPMVTIGRIPQPVAAPFFRITPAVKGTFRWSGTTTLIFTPEPKQKLPYATRYEVVIDSSATSSFGNRLAKPYVFSFTTPTVRLLSTNWYRKNGRADQPVVIGLRFNQPVRAADVAAHLRLAYQPHDWTRPGLPKEGRAFLEKNDPQAIADFEAKVARVQSVVSSNAPVFVFQPESWDQNVLGRGDSLVVLETRPGIPPDAWIKVSVGEKVPSPQGKATPGAVQEFTIQLEPTFFVKGFDCAVACDPDMYNPLQFRNEVAIDEARAKITASNVTSSGAPPLARRPRSSNLDEEGYERDASSAITLEDLGYQSLPAVTYRLRADRTLTAADGQSLGYTWAGNVENWHRTAFSSFGDGHGVWEKDGGTTLPFYARNLRNVQQWVAPLSENELVPTIVRQNESGFTTAPPVKPSLRSLNPTPDKIQSFGIDIGSMLSARGTGLLWTAIQDGAMIPRTSRAWDADRPRASIVQVTNLGINVKDSPQNVLIFVTTLDTATPVPGATVTIRTKTNEVLWTGTTDANGFALGPKNELRLGLPPREEERAAFEQRDPDEERQVWYEWWGFRFVVTAAKEGDFAYVGSDWNEGLDPWSFNLRYDVAEATPLLRGEVFTDRGVYKPGEEIHFKAILRTDTPQGIQLLPAGTSVRVVLRDSRGNAVDRRNVALNEWSSTEWTWRVPEAGALGDYSVSARVEGQRNTIWGSFLAAAYRRPDFRVDVTLTGGSAIAGESLTGAISGRYLFGAVMADRGLRWTYSRTPADSAPSAVLAKYPEERFTFVGWDWLSDEYRPQREVISTDEAKLDAKGVRSLKLDTAIDAGVPYTYTLEGEVADVSRQRIANRAALRVHPAPWYVGLKRPPFFVEAQKGFQTEVVAVTAEGLVAPGVPVTLDLRQIQWHSVRRAEGNGFYTWETERREVPAGTWEVTTTDRPIPLDIDVPNGGYYVLRAVAADGEGRSTRTITSFYALGAGYTAWERHDHNRIDLVPEKKSYRPGETARIMIKSPWETATALLTTEREGVRTYERFALRSTQQTVEIPITENDIPNLFVSVVLLKGRTQEAMTEDASDPGKPAFRIGYAELRVEDASKRLSVEVSANREEYRPATQAKVDLLVKDSAGRPAQAEVTLWAVDYGVLSLTAYRTPDILDSIYIPKALQVMNSDSRQRIISRRVITPKGSTEGGGGGRDAGDAVRSDFRVLAFWIGSVTTDARGRATRTVKLPESLTTYRIMAVVGDRLSRFGQDESDIRINKPVLLKQTFPRFLTPGDKAHFGAVVHNQVRRGGTATVTIRSLDPTILQFSGETTKRVDLGAGASREVRFDALPLTIGDARVQMTVRLLGESDGFEEVLPVRLLVSPETVAAYGEARPDSKQIVEIPAGVVPSFGGLQLELSSTALTGLSEGARFLLEYPYGCAEQRASRSLAIVLAADLGEAFRLPGIDASRTREVAQRSLRELERFQTASGGFGYWSANEPASPYLTSWVVHVYQRARALGYEVTPGVLENAYNYLELQLATERPQNESWWPAYTAWQAFTVKALVEGGRNADSHINRLYGYLDRMPLFAISFLYDALHARGERGARPEELRRRIMNSVLQEGGTAHVGELNDPYLLLFWSSNVRSTAIALGSLTRNADDPKIVTAMVRWLMTARKNGRWGNTQENAWAMEALVDYYRRYETEVPAFTASVALGSRPLASERFEGRSTEARTAQIAMPRLLEIAPPGQKVDLDLRREGTGTLFYMARLRYAVDQMFQTGLDNGFRIERQYAVRGGSAATSYAAGDLVQVTLTIRNTKERRWVAVSDPLPAGFEPVETAFATTAQDLADEQQQADSGDWTSWFRRGGFDHVERRDDRVNVFATRLGEGAHTYTYLARATTSGTFRTAPAHVEEMYQPEVFGRTATDVIEVKP